MKKNEII